MHIFWDFTRHCNLDCVHCYNAPERTAGPEDAIQALQLKTVEDLAENYPRATLHFLGGEPLVSRTFETVFQRAIDKGFRLEVTTNGTVSTDRKISLLRNNCDIVHLSLDSIDPDKNDAIRGKGVFGRVQRFITLWNNQNKRDTVAAINLSFTLTKISLSEAPRLVEFCLTNRIPRLTVSPIKILGSAENSSPHLSITARDYIQFVTSLAKSSLGEDLGIRATGGSQRFADYIKRNFYSKIVDVEPACDASIGQLRLSWDCKLAPCIMGAKAAPLFANEWTIDPNFGGVKAVLAAKSFKTFARNAHQASLRREPSVCTTCDYFKSRTCYAGCPIQKEYGPARLCEELSLNPIFLSHGTRLSTTSA